MKYFFILILIFGQTMADASLETTVLCPKIVDFFVHQANDIIGEYHLPNDLDVRIFKYKDKYYGKIIALNGFENGQNKDINNSDEDKIDDDLIGKIIIKGLEFDKDNNEWINGEMYGPEKGMYFNLKIIEINDNEIVVVGSKFLFWHTLKWKKL